MKNLLKISALAVLVAFAAFAVTSLNPSSVRAHEGEDHGTEAVAQENSDESSEEKQESPYTYTAQPGDSYTKIARKAVQTYGFNKNVNLSQAQIIAAETFLSSEAGFPSINAGEKVSLSEESVKAAVEKAQGLDQTTLAAWEKYVANVDFNTDKVGQSN